MSRRDAASAAGPRVAIVHDYIAHGGGAERVVLTMAKAFPDATLHTSIWRRSATYPEFAALDIRTTALDRFPPFRLCHRLAFPLLAPTFSRMEVEADVVLVSSTGWAHAAPATGPKVVYCHSPARWLYQPAERYLGSSPRNPRQLILRLLRAPLIRWDRRAAASASVYLANSTEVQRRIADCYGLDAEVLPAPHNLDPCGPDEPVPGIEPGFLLCVGRMVPYKNVHEVVAAFGSLPEHRLVVVGRGPLRKRSEDQATPNVTFLDSVPDEQMRWLYRSSAGLIAASFEDYGLTPLEAASFGRPTAAFRWGGFVDTIDEDRTGVFFDEPTPADIASAVRRLTTRSWDPQVIVRHAERFSEAAFIERLREVVLAQWERQTRQPVVER